MLNYIDHFIVVYCELATFALCSIGIAVLVESFVWKELKKILN
jgi:hypothetical protein